MDLFLIRVQEAKDLFNEYSRYKNLYANTPNSENELMLKDALAPCLQKFLEVCTELEARSESKVERELFRQFAGELTNIFK
jgi:hypothetical protein